MKKIILTLGILLSVVTIKAERIDFDYAKMFDVSTVWIDFNQNDTPELDEVFPTSKDVKCTLTINYKDFGSVGSMLEMVMPIINKSKKQNKTFRSNLEDVLFFKTESGYFATNKLKEKLFGIMKDKDGKYGVAIFNPAILK